MSEAFARILKLAASGRGAMWMVVPDRSFSARALTDAAAAAGRQVIRWRDASPSDSTDARRASLLGALDALRSATSGAVALVDAPPPELRGAGFYAALRDVAARLHHQENALIFLTTSEPLPEEAELDLTLFDTTDRPGRAVEAPLPTRYADLGLISSGGMGEVRRVYDGVLDRVVAMKIMRHDGGEARVRFEREARVLAQLQHPGIVAVHDFGALPDGRLWFTMPEVRGRTLRAVIDAVQEVSTGQWRVTSDRWSLNRLILALETVSQTVAYAHARGVVHRDLKPANILVGAFGEVLVIDFGIAQLHGVLGSGGTAASDPGLTSSNGAVIGTPRYMAPEQALGDLESQGPATDVWALGAVLLTMLTGQPPSGNYQAILRGTHAQIPDRPGQPPVPGALHEIARDCLAVDPAARPSMVVAARRLRTWLDGSERHAQALSYFREGQDRRQEAEMLRGEVTRVRGRAARMSARLKTRAAVADKRRVWSLEARADSLEAAAEAAETAWMLAAQTALSVDPDFAEAHSALADLYASRLRTAEREGDRLEETRNAVLLRAHAPQRLAAYLAQGGRVSLCTEPAGAIVTLSRFVERDRRLVPERVATLGVTPLRGASVPAGSLLLTVEAPGYSAARYPIHLERGEAWDGVAPDGTTPPVHLPQEDELAADDCFVPGGWFRAGGDPLAADPLPAQRFWVDSFIAKRNPVTVEELCVFFEALHQGGETARALLLAGLGAGAESPWACVTFTDGRFLPRIDHSFKLPVPGNAPATGMTWHCAVAYCAWRAEAEHRAWRLPHELEWEKLARGVDGRVHPWGRHFDASWANVSGSLPRATRCGVDTFADDVSVYGVRHVMGNARQWCANAYRPGGVRRDPWVRPAAEPTGTFRVVRGGSFFSSAALSRPAGRFAATPDASMSIVGFRMVRSP